LHEYAAKMAITKIHDAYADTAELGVQLAIKAVRMISRVTQYSAKQF